MSGCSNSGGGADKHFSFDGTEAMNDHAEGKDDAEKQDRNDSEDAIIAGSTTAGLKKKILFTPLKTSATLQPHNH